MADLRIVTVIVAAANAILAARLVRHRGALASLVAGGALALFPMAVAANKTVMLEPYLVLFCLIGASVMFAGDELASRRRLLIAGVAFGFAAAVKVWAVLPIVVAIVCCRPRWRRNALPLVAGVLGGSVVPTLPFFGLAPRNFMHELVTVQILRNRAPDAMSAADRLGFVTGVRGLPSIGEASATTVAGLLLALLVVLVAVAFALPLRRSTLDWFALATAGSSFAAMFLSPDFHPHYAYFSAAFVALLLGVSCDRVVRFVALAPPRPHHARRSAATIAPVAAVALIAIGSIWAINEETRYVRGNPGILTQGDRGHAISSVVPAGACTVTDQPALTLLADRFVPDRSGCPHVVDTFSTWTARDQKNLPPSTGPYDATLVNDWQTWLAAADYAVFSGPQPFRIPWPPELLDWFDRNYQLIAPTYGSYIYRFVGAPA